MEYHEAANIFPLDEKSIQDLSKDIKKNGLLVPIETMNGKIIDGRRRFIACNKVHIEPIYAEINVPDPIQYVLSLNLHRRHLTRSQLSIVAAKADKLRTKFATEARERQLEGLKKGNKPVKAGRPTRENPHQSRDDVGKVYGISGRSVERGVKVVKSGSPKVVEAVEKGEITVTKAESIVRRHSRKEDQEAEVERSKDLKKSKKEESNGEMNLSATKVKEDSSVDKDRRKALTAAYNVVDFLQRSTLVRLPVKNLNREEAFDYVIRWLRTRKKGPVK